MKPHFEVPIIKINCARIKMQIISVFHGEKEKGNKNSSDASISEND